MHARRPPVAPAALAVALSLVVPLAGAQDRYKLPPEPIRRCVEAMPPPSTSVDPTRRWLLLGERDDLPSIAELARPMLRLAGLRIDPATFGRHGARGAKGLVLKSIETGEERRIKLPEGADLGGALWTADGSRFAFTNTTQSGIELWVCDAATAVARQVPGIKLVATIGAPVEWMPDQQQLLCNVRVPGEPPPQPAAPAGPVILESRGKKAPVRTYQDLLSSAYDEALFAHYATSQLALVDPARGIVTKLGEPAIWTSVQASPDGDYLLATSIERPFSYSVPVSRFPHAIRVLDLSGKEIHRVADVPLSDQVPIGGVRTGPRSAGWIPCLPATLEWVEALDGGDPKTEVPHRDRVLVLAAPFTAEPREWMRTKERCSGILYGQSGKLALVTTSESWKRRWVQTWRADLSDLNAAPVLLHERATQDAYSDPGRPVMTRNEHGRRVIAEQDGAIFLDGDGASPDGDRPFLDRYDLASGAKERLFHCAAGRYESVVAPLDPKATRLLVRRESVTEFPNLYVIDRAAEPDKRERQLTQFTDAAATLTGGIERRFLKYQRADGVDLSGELFLPPGYSGGRLPLLVWAYPREYGSGRTAGQVRGSPHRYQRISGTSPLLLVLAGYAVLNNASMPIVGPVATANDTFVAQLVANAKAAIDTVVELGVADRERCAIAGHSYGAFMTANVLAHCDLFRAGIARSGAYNRTLTPFGFQRERRTYWQAPQVYFAMSPFMHAPKINEPLLLIHGEADNNSGTFTIQSERLFHAIQGHGGHARLVLLPHESHGYRARESVLHALAETYEWLEEHVKNGEPRQGVVVPAGAKVEDRK